jgi:enoyl-[acyl-carrier protein] reductase III
VSLLLGAAGANVIVNYVRHPEPANETAELLRRRETRADVIQADVSHLDDVARMVAAAEDRFGGIDILVSNAALGVFRELPLLDQRAVRRTFEIGAWGLLNVTTRLLPFFQATGFGRIIAISSVGAQRVGPGYAAVAMAKGALEALTRYLAAHVGELGDVTANVVSPSGFHGAHYEQLPYEPLRRHMAEREGLAPGGRSPTMEEVARAVIFLASDLGAGVNGQAIVVDRGWSIM